MRLGAFFARSAGVVATVAILAGSAVSLSACDAIKSLGGGDGGTSTGSGSGGGLLSFLGSDFEGEITMLVSSKSKTKKEIPTQIAFDIKKPKYRANFTGMDANPQLAGGGSLILDPVAKKGYLLIPAQKMAMVIDFEKMKAMNKGGTTPTLPGRPSTPSKPATPPKIDKTGKKDTVAGYTCDIWIITNTDPTTGQPQKAELCMAEGITWIDVSDFGWSSPEVAAAAAISDMNHFPLRLITYDAKGAEDTRMEAQKIDKKKLDDSLFTVPPDYKQMDLAAMMGGLMGGPMGSVPGGPPGLPPGFPNNLPKHR